MFKKLVLILVLVLISSFSHAQNIRITNQGQHPLKHRPRDMQADNALTDEYCATYEEDTGNWEWQTCGSAEAGAGDMTKAVYDNDDNGISDWADGINSSGINWTSLEEIQSGDINWTSVENMVADQQLNWDSIEQIASQNINWTEIEDSGSIDWLGGSESNNLETITTGIAVDEVPVGTDTNTVVYKVIADCDGNGSALNYDTTGHAFSCKTLADADIPNNITIDTATAAGTATLATTVTITDNEDTAENNPIVFVAGGDLDGGNLGLESDGTAYYTPSTGKITATGFVGALTGAVTGNASTATALAGDPTDCGANTCATAIAASGNLTCSITPLVSGGTLTSGRVCRYDGTGIDCDRLEDASGACAASSVCMGGHTHAISSEVSGLAANVATFLATPSSANFASACTDEDGTGDCGAGLVCMGGHTHSSYAPINNATMTGTFAIANNIVISGNRHKWRIAIPDPNTVVTASAVIPIGLTDAAMTVTEVEAQTSSASYEVAGDVKYADARIGLANATVVNDFDTTSGVRSDSTITSAAIASGKFVYLSFDSAPNASMTDCVITVTWDYN